MQLGWAELLATSPADTTAAGAGPAKEVTNPS